MKARIATFIIVIALLLGFGAGTLAQDRPYNLGSVWSLTFVKTRDNGGEAYVKNLAANWKKVQDEAIKQGLVKSYKVLWGNSVDRDDWDMLLMVEYKNYAVFDLPDETWDAIVQKVIGDESTQKQGDVARQEIREILGGKEMREIVLK